MTDGDRSSFDAADEGEVLRLVDEALELSAGMRDDFVVRASAGDALRLERVRALLAACARAESDGAFLGDPAAAFAASLVRSVDASEPGDVADAVRRVAGVLAGRYQLGHEIGRGGNAVVYVARDARHGRDVAVKIIRAGVAADEERQRFFREISVAAQVRHPYIVPLIDSGDASGVLYYVMPYIAGQSLRVHLDREGPLPVDECLALARDIAEALDTAHAAGIVHRDIKPQNILLGDGHALVADFGIALALERSGDGRLTERGVAVGTPAYMSPEQASASDRIDGRTDVYSLACVVYEMLTGEVPFSGVTPQAIRAKHLHAAVPELTILRPALPPTVQLTMARALAKAPADRHPTAGAFVAALQRAMTDAAPRRRLRLGRASAIAAGVAVAAAGMWLVARPEAPSATAAAKPSPDQRRIAVLYFDNLTGDEEIGRVASGLTEDLIDELSGVRGLRVISPNGVRPFRDRPPSIDSIARTLAVGTVVGGSLSASPTTLRATVRLLDPVTGEQLESHALDVKRGEALTLRRDVVTQVAAFLRTRLGQEIRLRAQRSEARSIGAWELVRRADELSVEGTDASNRFHDGDARDLLLRADSLYAAAQRLDPGWTAPVIGRGWASLRLSLISLPANDSTSPTAPTAIAPRMVDAIGYADQALAISAGAPEALGLRGFAREWLGTSGVPGSDTLLMHGEEDLRAALAERPEDARSWYALGELLAFEGRFAEAASALGTANDADAWLTEAPAVISELFFVSLSLERFAEAGRWCETGRARFAGDPRFSTCRLILLGWTGRHRADVASGWREVARIESADTARTLDVQWGFFRLMVAAVAARSGMPDSALAIVRTVNAAGAGTPGRPPFLEAEAYVRLLSGDRRGALRLLREEIAADPQAQRRIMRSPWFRELASDPGIAAALKTRLEVAAPRYGFPGTGVNAAWKSFRSDVAPARPSVRV